MKSPFSPTWNLLSPHRTEYEDCPKLLSGTTRVLKPNTPTSPISGLMSELSETLQIGSEELEHAFSKAKYKLSIKLDAEKRRDILKKKI
jgi:hypothetical protein